MTTTDVARFDTTIQPLDAQSEAVATMSDVMCYVAAVIISERERLAHIFEKRGLGDIASEIRETAMDDNVFKWNGSAHRD